MRKTSTLAGAFNRSGSRILIIYNGCAKVLLQLITRACHFWHLRASRITLRHAVRSFLTVIRWWTSFNPNNRESLSFILPILFQLLVVSMIIWFEINFRGFAAPKTSLYCNYDHFGFMNNSFLTLRLDNQSSNEQFARHNQRSCSTMTFIQWFLPKRWVIDTLRNFNWWDWIKILIHWSQFIFNWINCAANAEPLVNTLHDPTLRIIHSTSV